MTKDERKWYQKKYSYDRDDDGNRIYRTNYWKIASITTLVPAVILIAISLGLMIGWMTNVGTPFRREFGNYINSATDMYDPHIIVQTLEQAIQGIEDLGLEPTDNAALFPWDRNYKHTPQFSIDQITSVIDYADSFIEWKESSYNTTIIEVAADVYDAKMSHLRKVTSYIDTSTVAYAYCLNTPGCLWYAYDLVLFMVGMITFLAGMVLGMISSDK